MGKKITSGQDELRFQESVRTIRIIPRRTDQSDLSLGRSQEGETQLGEVRVRVKLTNAGDEILVRRGLLLPDGVRSYEADALVDTGAIRSVLPNHVVERLGLAIVRKTRAVYANDTAEDVDVSEVVGIEIDGRRTTEEALVLGSEVLIGQTVLESLDLLVDCITRRVIPNPAHPDQPMIKVKVSLASFGKLATAKSLK